MAKQGTHKAATEVSVAPLAERSPLEEFVYAHWLKATLVFLVASAVILWSQSREQEVEQINDSSWTNLGSLLEFVEAPGGSADPEGLRKAATELDGTLAGPWAQALVGPALASEGDYQGALAAAQTFQSNNADSLLLALTTDDGDGGRTGLLSHFEGSVRAMADFQSANSRLFSNPEPPADAPRVVLETTAGSIEVALYENLAPGHCANFLSRAEGGLYDNTKFHRVMENFMIQGGDPNSIDGDPSTWGQGGGDETQPQEFSELAHFEGFLAMAKRPNETESSIAQFYITLGSPHHLDNVHTVFGKVVGGMDVVRSIGSGAIEEGTSDRPASPVTVTSVRRP